MIFFKMLGTNVLWFFATYLSSSSHQPKIEATEDTNLSAIVVDADKIMSDNRLVAVQGHDHPDLYHSFLTASNINWISGSSPGENDIITSKIRYRSKDSSCKIKKESDSILVEFDSPQFAIAPGQSIVFYHNDVCIGGGIIEARSNTPSH